MRLVRISIKTLFFAAFYIACSFADGLEKELYPEQSEIDALAMSEQLYGVVFLVMEQDEDALTWVLPRVIHYTKQLRSKWKDLKIIVLSHGNEMFALQSKYKNSYSEIHNMVAQLISVYDVLYQVCGSYAKLSDIDTAEFPSYVDVVPFAPAEIENYRLMDYQMVNLDLTW